LAIRTVESKSSNDYLIWKYPNREIEVGSQVIVNESEEALLFENGQLIEILDAGRHVIESGNIPGMDGIIRRSIGNNSPIKIDVWFVSKVVSTDYKWGVQLQVKDNTHQLIVPVGSYGSILLRIEDPASLVLQVVGKKKEMSKDELKDFLMPSIERSLKEYIAEKIKQGTLDVFNIETILVEASNKTKDSLEVLFERFGLKVIEFFIQGIEVIGDNPEYKKIKESLADAASLRIRAKAASDTKGFYQEERTLDALNKAAEKDSNLANNFLNKQTSGKGNKKTLKEKLSDLKELLEADLISEKEYNEKRLKLLEDI
tara:strand:+ start:547 stop:1491 length:945 start_codon:yes stop_codon:yes gene_type:complete